MSSPPGRWTGGLSCWRNTAPPARKHPTIPEAGSPARVEVCPHLDYVPNLEGGMLTEYGLVTFRYYPKDGGMQYELALPEGMEGSFRGANGGSAVLRAGKNEIWEPVKKA